MTRWVVLQRVNKNGREVASGEDMNSNLRLIAIGVMGVTFTGCNANKPQPEAKAVCWW